MFNDIFTKQIRGPDVDSAYGRVHMIQDQEVNLE